MAGHLQTDGVKNADLCFPGDCRLGLLFLINVTWELSVSV